MAQLTQQGFTVRTLQQIIDEISSNLKAQFGDDFDTSTESPDGQLIKIFAEQLWTVEQAAQAAYQSSDPDSASDIPLEYVCDYNGVYRREGESDAQLRNRRGFSVINTGTNTIEAVISDLEKMGVDFVSVNEDVTNNTYTTVVKGGEDAAIAQAIFNNGVAGILSSGTTMIPVQDSKGYPHEVRFSRPTDQTIKVAVKYKKLGSVASNDLADNIKSYVSYYIENLLIGEDVVWSSVFGAAITGANKNGNDASLTEVKIDNGTTDIVIAPDKKARCLITDVTVTEVIV